MIQKKFISRSGFEDFIKKQFQDFSKNIIIFVVCKGRCGHYGV